MRLEEPVASGPGPLPSIKSQRLNVWFGPVKEICAILGQFQILRASGHLSLGEHPSPALSAKREQAKELSVSGASGAGAWVSS